MKAWKLLLIIALVSIGVNVGAAFLQNVVLSDVKTNGTGLSYFAGLYPVKFWNFRSQNIYHANAGNITVPTSLPSLAGATQRELRIGVVPYNADAGTAMVDTLIFNPAPSPSPTIGAACAAGVLEGQVDIVRGHGTSDSTTVTCCYKSGTLKYVRGLCE